jgi:hypothetical protein
VCSSDLSSEGAGIPEVLNRIRQTTRLSVVTAHPYTNLSGMVAMGALPGVRPGAAVRKGPDDSSREPAVVVDRVDLQKHRKVLYVLGESCPERLPPHDYLIFQNAFPAFLPFQPNLILPSSLYTESRGTMISVEGKCRPLEEVVKPLGQSRPDWFIVSRIAEGMHCARLAYTEVSSIQGEIKKYVRGIPDGRKRMEFLRFARKTADFSGFVAYSGRRVQEMYRGMALSEVVPGMKRLAESSATVER